MTIEEARYNEVMRRLDNLNAIDIDERFTFIEKHLKQIILATSGINHYFQNGIKIQVDQTALNVINPLRETLDILRKEAKAFHDLRKALESDSVLGALKYMAKQITELTQTVTTIKEEGIKKAIHLDLTMDGYEMVKKRAPKINDEIPEQRIDPEQCTEDLLKTLTPREQKVLWHRYGLFGEKEKSLVATAKILKISGERVRAIQHTALRKLRHPSRKELVRNLTHLDLKIDIGGEK